MVDQWRPLLYTTLSCAQATNDALVTSDINTGMQSGSTSVWWIRCCEFTISYEIMSATAADWDFAGQLGTCAKASFPLNPNDRRRVAEIRESQIYHSAGLQLHHNVIRWNAPPQYLVAAEKLALYWDSTNMAVKTTLWCRIWYHQVRVDDGFARWLWDRWKP